jgi:hypothetical protein
LAGNRLAHAIGTLQRRLAPHATPPSIALARPNLDRLAQPDAVLPEFVAADPVARKYLDLLGPLDWAHFPGRPAHRPWPGPAPVPRAPYVAAFLVKLNEGLRSMGHLRRYLLEHPALVSLLGFPLVPDPTAAHGFNVERSVPSRRHLGRVLRELDPAATQFPLTATVQLIATQVPDWGEFVLAELTQTFDKGDASYFFPLMRQVEQRLGRRPRYGAFDAAFDAFYVHQYFHEAGGFAAVPLFAKGGYQGRTFSPAGLPLCAAGLAMPLKFAFIDRTSTLVVHERGKYICPQRNAQPTPDSTCPVNHERWAKGGCTAMLPTCAGARLRYQLDRHSAEYTAVCNQRTADERINAQAKALGIERLHLRRHSAIANLNTLIYVLINLRLLQRIRIRQEQLPTHDA